MAGGLPVLCYGERTRSYRPISGPRRIGTSRQTETERYRVSWLLGTYPMPGGG
jgi:hypothetical protein